MQLKQQIDALDHWELMEKVLGHAVLPRKMYSSPLREGDRHPSFGLFRADNGQARWKDFAYESGDVYQLAMHFYRCDFRTALRKVAQLAGILPGHPGAVRPPRLQLARMIENERAKCMVGVRDWRPEDTDYWTGRFFLVEEDLAECGIFPAEVFITENGEGRKTTFLHHPLDPLYVMRIGAHGHLKSYRPLHANRRYRYLGNTDRNDVFGEHLLEAPSTALHPVVITAGQKDGVCGMVHLEVVPLAFNSESCLPDDRVMARLFRKSGMRRFFSLYDNDAAGERYAKKMSDRYPWVTAIRLGAFTDLNDLADLVELRQSEVIQTLKHIVHDPSPADEPDRAHQGGLRQ
jgi:hypothetical protein